MLTRLDVALRSLVEVVYDIENLRSVDRGVGARLEVDVAVRAIQILDGLDVVAQPGRRIDRALLELRDARDFLDGEDLRLAVVDFADVILRPLADDVRDVDFLAGAIDSRRQHFGVDVAVVLIEFAERAHVLGHLVGIEPAALGEDVEDALRFRLHDPPQLARFEGDIPLEFHRAHDRLAALVDRERDLHRAGGLLAGRDLHVHVRVAARGVVFEELLAVAFERRLVERVVRLDGDLLANAGRFEPRDALDVDRGNLRLALHHDHDFYAVALLFAEDADIREIARGVEAADVLLHRLLRERLADLRAHVGENFLAAHGLRAGVLNLNGADHQHRRRGRCPGHRELAEGSDLTHREEEAEGDRDELAEDRHVWIGSDAAGTLGTRRSRRIKVSRRGSVKGGIAILRA